MKFGMWPAAVVMSLASTAASAVTFDFQPGSGSDELAAPVEFSEGGIDLTVSVFKSVGPGVVSRGGNGLAVNDTNINLPCGTPANGNCEDRWISVGQGLTFTFDPAVTLLSSILIERGNGTETVRISNGTLFEDFDISSGPETVTLIPALSGTEFSIELIASTGSEGVRVNRLEVTAIPLPPAILGIVSAFALAFGVRRASQRSAA